MHVFLAYEVIYFYHIQLLIIIENSAQTIRQSECISPDNDNIAPMGQLLVLLKDVIVCRHKCIHVSYSFSVIHWSWYNTKANRHCIN